jgi:phosphatidylglycerophosphatase A
LIGAHVIEIIESSSNPSSNRVPVKAAVRPDFQFMRSKASRWIALGFGAGLSPVAPGTVGTLWAWAAFLWIDPWLADVDWALLISFGAVIGIVACRRTAEALGVQDHGAIVWDEVIAFWLVLWVLNGSFSQQVTAFLVFRFFDIVKPPPIRWIDRTVGGGWGVMADDLAAAMMTLLVLAIGRSLA